MENDMLSSLLRDPAALQSAVQAVSGLLGGAPADGDDPAAAQSSRYTASGLPGGVSGDGDDRPAQSGLPGGAPERAQGTAADSYDPAAEMMQRALPVLGAIMQSGQGAVRQEKRALLGALKPFVTPEVAGQFDHALRLVSMARMARAAMGQLGRLGQMDGEAADGLSALTAQKEDDSYV